MSTEPNAPAAGDRPRKQRAGVFDVRVIIGVLLGIYGVVLTIYGLVGTTEADLAKANGTNLNLWTGISLIIASVGFLVWAGVRPVLVEVTPSSEQDAGGPPAH
jgi:hypothetical protein